jgi:pimeloyl-ACP methyl ester carboxylesterase
LSLRQTVVATRFSQIQAPDAPTLCEISGLAWYRARGERQPIAPTKVPTLFLWGEADDTVGRIAAEGTAEFIEADYHFVPLPGVGHYAADQVPARVNDLLLEHLTRHPV